jgi:hypothetical protein
LVNRNQGQRGAFSARISKDGFLPIKGMPELNNRCGSPVEGQLNQGGAMTDLLNLAMLVCAAVGSMVFGILLAYGILRIGFALMRRPARAAVLKTQPEVARAL